MHSLVCTFSVIVLLFIVITDKNTLENNTEEQVNNMIREQLKHNTQVWEQLLHATGGKLELSKCKFTILNWNHNTTPRITTQSAEPIKIKDKLLCGT